MKRAKRIITSINITTLFFIAVSFTTGTFAWFAYSGLSNVGTEIDIKSWNIEINKDGQESTNDLMITLPTISPGMEPVKDTITITNKGDAEALLKYNIKNARILYEDEFVSSDELPSNVIEDKIAHAYPFHINIALTKDYIKTKSDVAVLEVTVSWPLDSGNDEIDSHWGTKAYEFQNAETKKLETDETYSAMLPIELTLELSAEQYVGGRDSLHLEYAQNNMILSKNNMPCLETQTGCIKNYVIDPYNIIENETVTLLPDLNSTTISGDFSSQSTLENPLNVKDILKIISRDVMNTEIVNEKLSNMILGTTNDENRINEILQKIKENNSIIEFDQSKFKHLKTLDCVWLGESYSDTHGFALVNGKIYPENKETSCKIISLNKINKIDFNQKNNN